MGVGIIEAIPDMAKGGVRFRRRKVRLRCSIEVQPKLMVLIEV